MSNGCESSAGKLERKCIDMTLYMQLLSICGDWTSYASHVYTHLTVHGLYAKTRDLFFYLLEKKTKI